MEVALFGFFGVLLGALISAGTQIALEMWRRQTAEAKEAAARTSNRRLIARLVDAELQVASAALEFCQKEKGWWPTTMRLSTNSWEEGKSVLAEHVDFDRWQSVMMATIAIQMLDGAYRQQVELGATNKRIPDDVIDGLDDWVSAIGEARRALSPDVRETHAE